MRSRLIFYSHHAKKLLGSVGAKINAFVTEDPDERYIEQIPGLSERMGCVAYSRETKCHYVLPLKGYNKQTYEISHNKLYKFECGCQGWKKSRRIWEAFSMEMEAVRPLLPPHQFERHKAMMLALNSAFRPPCCSHCAAVYEYYARRSKILREAKLTQAMLTMFEVME